MLVLLLLPRARLHARSGRLAVPLLRVLRRRHQPGRRLARARLGLKVTLFAGLGMQIVALGMLAFAPEAWLSVPYVMAAQALSGIAKDLTKMSSKSAVKLLVPEDAQSTLLQVGGDPDRLEERAQGRRLLPRRAAADAGRLPAGVLILAGLVLTALLVDGAADARRPRARRTPRPSSASMFSNNRAVNVLAAARVFLFARATCGSWSACRCSCAACWAGASGRSAGFLAVWVIGYGVVQASAPRVRAPATRRRAAASPTAGRRPGWPSSLAAFPAGDRGGPDGRLRPGAGGGRRA